MQQLNKEIKGFNQADVPVYFSIPENAEGRALPAVVLIHEIWGLDGHIRELADRIAAEGFVVAAPDLFYGEIKEHLTEEKIKSVFEIRRAITPEIQGDKEQMKAFLAQYSSERQQSFATLMAVLGPNYEERFIADVRAVFDSLAAMSEVDTNSIFSIGFCFGGGLVAKVAAAIPGFAGHSIFYGNHTPDDRIEKITAPVRGFYGSEDHRITDGVPAFAEKMKAAGKDYEYEIYEGAPHAFFNDTRPAYHKMAAEDAWKKVLAFLGKE